MKDLHKPLFLGFSFFFCAHELVNEYANPITSEEARHYPNDAQVLYHIFHEANINTVTGTVSMYMYMPDVSCPVSIFLFILYLTI